MSGWHRARGHLAVAIIIITATMIIGRTKYSTVTTHCRHGSGVLGLETWDQEFSLSHFDRNEQGRVWKKGRK